MLKLTEHVGNTIFVLYKEKTRWNSDIQNFYSEILNFRLFLAKNRNFQVPHVSMPSKLRNASADCTHLVCMNKEDPYLPIDIKINFIEGSVIFQI